MANVKQYQKGRGSGKRRGGGKKLDPSYRQRMNTPQPGRKVVARGGAVARKHARLIANALLHLVHLDRQSKEADPVLVSKEAAELLHQSDTTVTRARISP